VGIYLSRYLSKHDHPFLIDAGLGLAAFSLLGGRISYLAANYSYYSNHPLEIPQFWLGGLSWPGALLAAAIAIYLIHLIWKEPLGEIADIYLPLLGIMAVGIWLTGWGTGIGYGPIIEAWYGIPVRDIFGVLEYRWPLPIVGALLSGGWVAGMILYPLKRGRPPGTRALLSLVGLGAVNALLSFLRVDPAPTFWGLRSESWISLTVLAASLIGTILLTKDDPEHEPAGS
jgi:phosphatidylglycerol:prolipoprotein diacylglycerol transferase